MGNLRCHGVPLDLVTSSTIRGIQMGEISRLGWLIGVFKHSIWAYSLYFLCLLLLSISKILASSQTVHDRPRRHFVLIWIFLADPLSNYAYSHGGSRLVVCLFHQCIFCNTYEDGTLCSLLRISLWPGSHE
jgi:hypothetical protein